jgi:transcriptional regulator with XRE-family HTH domain
MARAFKRAQGRLAANIIRLRTQRKLSQEQAAELIGLSVSQLSRLERGAVNSSLATMAACAVAFRVDLAELLREK